MTAASQALADVLIPPSDDDFFQNEPGLIAKFDFDYNTMVDFNVRLQWAVCALNPPCWATALCCYPCFLRKNVEWDQYSRHVALTVDGIKFVHDKRKSLCGLSCSDKGKESKTVPYDKITDCDVQEPAGTACCCCIQRVLYTVTVDTASSGARGEGPPSHELTLSGLRHPHEFKQAVWSMKRGEAPRGAVAASYSTGQGAAPLPAPAQATMNSVALLTEIRDELRQLNATMAAK